MSETKSKQFLSGVVEGFYGKPWTLTERIELFQWMSGWGLNSYLYAPKDDLKHRNLWRDSYSVEEARVLGETILACKERSLRFIYGLGPGLDIRYSSTADLDHLKNRFDQLLYLGADSFGLFFDDIPDRMNPEDAHRFGSFALAQSHVVNLMFQWVKERRPESLFLFCPTPYCGRMALRGLGGINYLETIGRELLPEIEICWTGPEIISETITAPHIRELQTILRRKPLIWDNLHANDYDGQRFYCGPYAGRPPELRELTSGILANPNNEFPLNFVPLRTLAEFTNGKKGWNDREAYLDAMREWHAHFETIGQPILFEDLVFLGDCYYLPHRDGPEADAFYNSARRLLAKAPAERGSLLDEFNLRAKRLRECCSRMTELRERPLFYALSRRVWDLREELDLLDRHVTFLGGQKNASTRFSSDFHLSGTYRGGIVRRLQTLLCQNPDGTFESSKECHE